MADQASGSNALIVYGSSGKTLLFSPEELVMPQRLSELNVPWLEKQWEQLKSIYVRRIMNMNLAPAVPSHSSNTGGAHTNDDSDANSNGINKKSKLERYANIESVIAEMAETLEARWHKRKEDKKKYNAAKKKKKSHDQESKQHEQLGKTPDGEKEGKTQKRARDSEDEDIDVPDKIDASKTTAVLDLIEVISIFRREKPAESLSESLFYKNAKTIVCLTNIAENASERFLADSLASTDDEVSKTTTNADGSSGVILAHVIQGLSQFGKVVQNRWLVTDPDQMRTLFTLPSDYRQHQANYIGSDDDEDDVKEREKRDFDMSVRIDVQFGSAEAAEKAVDWAHGQWFNGRRIVAALMADLLQKIDQS